jgi:hypothetical protein
MEEESYMNDRRKEEYSQYLRVLDFAKKSSLLMDDSKYPSTNSDIMREAEADQFDFKGFSQLFTGFEEFLNQCFEAKLDLMISGSSVLHSSITRKIIHQNWKPVDADIYMNAKSDQQETLKAIDIIIRQIYKKIDQYQIRLFRTPYILTWLVIKENKSITSPKEYFVPEEYRLPTTFRDVVIMSYQVILSPCLRWEHVFAGYHTDMVCAGYLTSHKKFITTSRFDYWADKIKILIDHENHKIFKQYYIQLHETNKRTFWKHGNFRYEEPRIGETVSYFFPDLVSPRYRDRVVNACEKYLSRGYACHLIQPFNEIYIQDIERSGDNYSIIGFLEREECDIGIHINNLENGDIIERHGPTLADVYQGETFASILETMSCFRKCPGGCGSFVMGYSNTDNGFFCEECNQKEIDKIKQLTHTLDKNNDLTAFITGARCGLGLKMKTLFEEYNWLTYGTTRFLNLTNDQKNMIELDLKNPESWTNSCSLLEKGIVNVLVLSASETLHYPSDDKNPIRNDVSTKDSLSFDWTNDFQRLNSGVWHKTLDQHSDQEIISPLLTNVAGTAKLLASFLKGIKFVRSAESLDPTKKKATFTCIVVTSFEGRFADKTPFHPITNACKSAIEQIVWTVQAQAKFLDCSIILSDPGWVYTESAFGKTKGPVTIEYGVSQILQPLILSLSKRINFKIYRREFIGEKNNLTNSSKQTSKEIYLLLKPCHCIIKFGNFSFGNRTKEMFIIECPYCNKGIESRNIYDFRSEITFLLIIKSYNLPKDVINFILQMAGYPILPKVIR